MTKIIPFSEFSLWLEKVDETTGRSTSRDTFLIFSFTIVVCYIHTYNRCYDVFRKQMCTSMYLYNICVFHKKSAKYKFPMTKMLSIIQK